MLTPALMHSYAGVWFCMMVTQHVKLQQRLLAVLTRKHNLLQEEASQGCSLEEAEGLTGPQCQRLERFEDFVRQMVRCYPCTPLLML